jgi:predicted XRE-type DNA-binding protein
MASAKPKRKPKARAVTKVRGKRRPAPKPGAKNVRKAAAKGKNPHEGSSLDDFLREEGLFEEATTTAIKETIAWQVARSMEEQELSKTEMARRMGTSRAAVDRILDPENASVTLSTLFRTAAVLGLELSIELREPAAS